MLGSMFRRIAVVCIAVICCLSACGAAGSASLDRDAVPVPRCVMEDGSTSDGYQPVCYWDATTMGNGTGTSYILVDGECAYQW